MTGVPTHRMALGIEYTGTRFYGWQKQPDQRTVQTELEKALSRFVIEPVATICAGRTDTGVHAVSQVVHIDVACRRGEANWIRGVNTFLPPDVAVRWAREVDADFSARFSAVRRTYEYWIYNNPIRSPVFDALTGWVWRPLDADRMREAGLSLLGKHDFTSFRAADCDGCLGGAFRSFSLYPHQRRCFFATHGPQYRRILGLCRNGTRIRRLDRRRSQGPQSCRCRSDVFGLRIVFDGCTVSGKIPPAVCRPVAVAGGGVGDLTQFVE